MTPPRPEVNAPRAALRPAVFCRAEGAPQGFLPPHLLSGLPPETDLLVGFSGGADSTLLLYLCVRYAVYAGCRVFAAHLHHGIRGEEAGRDEDFCRRTAARLGVPLFVGHADIPALAKAEGDSLETRARAVRYDFFHAVMAGGKAYAHPDFTCEFVRTPACPAPPRHISLLLTAHHADDQLETLLLRLVRGTGIDGLSGIPPVRRVPGGLAVRPLLRCTKQDILTACASLGLAYVTDSTNENGDNARSILRRAVLPALCNIAGTGAAEAAACRLADSAREDAECLAVLAAEWYAAHRDCLSAEALAALPPALENRVFLLAWRAACVGETPDAALPADRTLTAAHLTSLRTLCERRVPHSEVSLPGGLCGSLADPPDCLFTFLPPAAPQAAPAPCALHPGDNVFGVYRIRVEAVTLPVPPASPAPLWEGLFPPDVGSLPLTARPRAAGDRILRHGIHQSLKKLYCDSRVPSESRAGLPVICALDGILWVPSVGFADGFPAPEDGNALRIAVYRQE